MQGDILITDKELNQLMDKAYQNLQSKFDPKNHLFFERMKGKIRRFKKLNETEIKRLKEIAQ